MITELLSENGFIWMCLWQSTACVAAGLIGSFILRRRPARAHQVLLLAMIAALAVPAMSIMVKHLDLGLLSAEPTAVLSEKEIALPQTTYAAAEIIAGGTIEYDPPAAEAAEVGPAATVVAEKAELPWRRILSWAWIAASIILAVRLGVTFVRGVRLLHRAKPLCCQEIQEAVRVAQAKLKVSKDVSVLGSRNIRSPMIWCWRKKPAFLLPSATVQSLSEINWVSVLCHELAHYKRHDHISGLFAEIAACVLPWNPFLWLAKSQLIKLSEQACDDWVVAAGQPSTDYARSLLDLVPQGQIALVPTVVASKKELKTRVRRIVQNHCGDPRAGGRWTVLVSIVAACLAVGAALAQEGRANKETPRRETAAPEPRPEGKVPRERTGEPGEAERAELIQLRKTFLEKISRIERELEQLPDGKDAEARELQARLREIRQQVRDIDRRLAGRERDDALIPEQREADARTRELAAHRRELQQRTQQIERRLAEHPDSPEAKELRAELREIHQQIQRINQELAELERPPRGQREQKAGGADARTTDLMRQRGELIARALQIKRQITEAGDTEHLGKLREEEAVIREKIEAIERQLRSLERERQRPEQARIEELRQAIARAVEQRRGDEAERLERELRQIIERPVTRPEPRPEAPGLEQQVLQLRNEVKGLRQEMAELRELLKQLLQQQRPERQRRTEQERPEREQSREGEQIGMEKPRF